MAGQAGVDPLLEPDADDGHAQQQQADGDERRNQPPLPGIGEEDPSEVVGVAQDGTPTGPARITQPEEGEPGLEGDGPARRTDEPGGQDQPDLGEDVAAEDLTR